MLGIVFLKAASPLVESSDTPLPVDAWYPYSIDNNSINNKLLFFITYLHQVILGTLLITTRLIINYCFSYIIINII